MKTSPEPVECNCATISPTMPTCRSTHLYRCPLYWVGQVDVLKLEIANLEQQLTAQRQRVTELEGALKEAVAMLDDGSSPGVIADNLEAALKGAGHE